MHRLWFFTLIVNIPGILAVPEVNCTKYYLLIQETPFSFDPVSVSDVDLRVLDPHIPRECYINLSCGPISETSCSPILKSKPNKGIDIIIKDRLDKMKIKKSEPTTVTSYKTTTEEPTTFTTYKTTTLEPKTVTIVKTSTPVPTTVTTSKTTTPEPKTETTLKTTTPVPTTVTSTPEPSTATTSKTTIPTPTTVNSTPEPTIVTTYKTTTPEPKTETTIKTTTPVPTRVTTTPEPTTFTTTKTTTLISTTLTSTKTTTPVPPSVNSTETTTPVTTTKSTTPRPTTVSSTKTTTVNTVITEKNAFEHSLLPEICNRNFEKYIESSNCGERTDQNYKSTVFHQCDAMPYNECNGLDVDENRLNNLTRVPIHNGADKNCQQYLIHTLTYDLDDMVLYYPLDLSTAKFDDIPCADYNATCILKFNCTDEGQYCVTAYRYQGTNAKLSKPTEDCFTKKTKTDGPAVKTSRTVTKNTGTTVNNTNEHELDNLGVVITNFLTQKPKEDLIILIVFCAIGLFAFSTLIYVIVRHGKCKRNSKQYEVEEHANRTRDVLPPANIF